MLVTRRCRSDVLVESTLNGAKYARCKHSLWVSTLSRQVDCPSYLRVSSMFKSRLRFVEDLVGRSGCSRCEQG